MVKGIAGYIGLQDGRKKTFTPRQGDYTRTLRPQPRPPADVVRINTPAVNLVPNQGLSVLGLTKRFGGRYVLRNVSMTIRRGEIVGLLGPNGAGKTTCFYVMMGAVRPEQGRVLLNNTDITSWPIYARARASIGYLPQEQSIFRGLSVEENLRAVIELIESDRRVVRDRVEELLEEFAIGHLRRSPAISLSGGERRRCEIARALANRPNFLLLDEPFAGVDPLVVEDTRQLIQYLQSRGVGILITDHSVREILNVVTRAYILHSGEVLVEGTPDEIMANQSVRQVYLGHSFRF